MKTSRKNKGFSLAETLIAVALMSIIMAAATAGIIGAQNSYARIVKRTDALTLMSTIAVSMEADLSSAVNPANTTITAVYAGAERTVSAMRFESKMRGYTMFYDNIDGQICVIAHDYGNKYMVIPIASDATHTSKLISHLESLVYDEENHYFEFVLEIYDKENTSGEPIVTETYDVRTFE